MAKKAVTFKTRIGMLKHLPGMRYLEIPVSAVKALGGKFRLRVVCEVKSKSGKLSYQGGLVALGGGKAIFRLLKHG